MGCWASRPDETGLVALCRSRQALIREAADRRYALAAAHSAYFSALAAVADALLSYAKEALPPPSPVVTLPSSGKGTDSSATPLSHSLSDDNSASGSHLHLSDDSDEETETGSGKGGDPTPQPQSSSAWPSPSYYYMRSSTAIPTMVYGDTYGGYPFGFPGRSVDDPDFYYGRPANPTPTARVSSPPPPPPPPPPPQGSAWDFFDPFSSYEQFMPVYSPVQYGTASVGSSPSSSEVRAREGIPDLEDATEPEPLTRAKKGKAVAEDIGAKDSGIGSSKNVAAKEMDEFEEKESMPSSGKKASKAGSTEKGSQGSSAMSVGGSSGEQGSSSKKKGVSFEDGSSLVSERSRPSGGDLSQGSRDVVETLGEIKEEFQSAIVGSMEVSKLLEVWRMPYRPRNKVFKVISSRILGIVGFRLSTRRLFKHRHHLAATTMKSRSTSMEFENHINMKSGNLSSTLEKLHVWEKKLYGEVKAEERLRAIYDKKCRRLKSLDDRGAEPHKIDATRVSVRALRTKISIAITSVDVISRRIHRIRDEELQPQLVELIQGLLKMWKTLLGCHHNQLHAIIASKSDNLTIRTAVQDSVAKATMDLELSLLNWYARFDEWINTQKFFVSALNGWLMKWLPEDREETSDGIAPFSPNRIGAPPVFALSNDWFQATSRSLEAEVKLEIQSFAAKMHKLWKSQDEERQQNQNADSLSKEYSIKLKNLQKEHGNRAVVSTPNSEHIYDGDHTAALDTKKKTLDEVRAKHDEAVRQVQELGSASLKTGLTPIFQSLNSFYTETLQAYEGIRIPNNGGGN